MKRIKRFIYRTLYRHWSWRRAWAGESFEIASLDGDHASMVYWDKRYAKCFAKSDKYYYRLRELN